MWDQIRDLHVHHGDVPVEVRLLKLTEEVGEAAEAFIGMHGLNSRKGVCRSRDDLLAELADVIITAASVRSVNGLNESVPNTGEQRMPTPPIAASQHSVQALCKPGWPARSASCRLIR